MSTVEVTDHDRLYWQYEYDVVAHHLVPLLRLWNVRIEGAKLLDVGCGDGGGLCALFDAGMTCKGFDIEDHRIHVAQTLSDGRLIELTVGNIYENPTPFAGEIFDLIILHDVFEHLDRKVEALNVLRRYLASDGRVLITFPPYYSAFGAHQQFLQSPLGKIPFIHIVPFMMSKVIPALSNEHKPFIEEIRKLGRLKMGIGKFERLVKVSGFQIEQKKLYLVSPNHIRFGFKPLDAGILGRIPLIREVLVSGTVFLLKPLVGRGKTS